ncbi:MAG: zf-TFIIB domain-containing protein [Deltaproteobacteria bacterium]|jgi:Zn-finger nucleic acid-binding protein|nr:zf-TFIIB domain-containing protein [Deltaproteobacteria bacterium]
MPTRGVGPRIVDAAVGLAVGVLSPELGLATFQWLGENREEKDSERQRERFFAATMIASAGRPKPTTPGPTPFTPVPEPDLARWECPRCRRGLEVATIAGLHLHPCEGCGGLAIEASSLAGLSDPVRQVTLQSYAEGLAQGRTVEIDPLVVRYLDCPRCSGPTLRRNFERVSGVIVDVCLQHSVWFDREELPRALRFLANGGTQLRAKAEAEEAQRQDEERRRIKRMEARTPQPRRSRLDLDFVDLEEP